ncbi:hypothetical protein PIB30_052017, partial [Stylosanthes scabra]|nr:hypothetical protein [Stylosanthes scabra]
MCFIGNKAFRILEESFVKYFLFPFKQCPKLDTYQDLRLSSPRRSTATIATLLKACKTIDHLYQVHTSIIHRGLEQDHFIMSRLISVSASFGAPASYSTAVFDRVLSPSTFLWNTLIGAHNKRSSSLHTLSTFLRMKAHGSHPD